MPVTLMRILRRILFLSILSLSALAQAIERVPIDIGPNKGAFNADLNLGVDNDISNVNQPVMLFISSADGSEDDVTLFQSGGPKNLYYYEKKVGGGYNLYRFDSRESESPVASQGARQLAYFVKDLKADGSIEWKLSWHDRDPLGDQRVDFAVTDPALGVLNTDHPPAISRYRSSNRVAFLWRMNISGRNILFVRDMSRGQNVMATDASVSGVYIDPAKPYLDGTGDRVVFTAREDDNSVEKYVDANGNEVAGNGVQDVYLFSRDPESGLVTKELVNMTYNGQRPTGAPRDSESGPITPDGRYAVFTSNADNIVAGDTNSYEDVFLRDLFLKKTALVSVANWRTDGVVVQGVGRSLSPSVSDNGYRVAFQSGAQNLSLEPVDGPVADQIYVRDLITQQTFLISKNASGERGNGHSSRPVISPDGKYVAFESDASNLILNDQNTARDVFLAQVPNQRPVIVEAGNSTFQQTINENEPLSFTVNVIDTDGDPFTLSATGLPAGASFDPSARLFQWKPTYLDGGRSYAVNFTAAGQGGEDTKTVTITVVNVNAPPEIANISNQSINENETLRFTVTATDPDKTELNFQIFNIPPNAVFDVATKVYDPNTGTTSQDFVWTPTSLQTGRYSNIRIEASDGSLTARSNEFVISVGNVDHPPQLDVLGDQNVLIGRLLEFLVTASDPDIGDVITYSATGLPEGAVFSGQKFQWTPGANQAGTYQVTFTAEANGLTDQQTITVTVTDRPLRIEVKVLVAGQETNTVSANESFDLVVTLFYTDGSQEAASALSGDLLLTAEPAGTTTGLTGNLNVASSPLSGGKAVISETYNRSETIVIKVIESRRNLTGLTSALSVRPSEKVPPKAEILGGDFFEGKIRAGKDVTLKVTLIDSLNSPLANKSIRFELDGPGQLSSPSVVTGTDGTATATLTTTGNADGTVNVRAINQEFPDRITPFPTIEVYGPPRTQIVAGENAQIVTNPNALKSQSVIASDGQVILAKPDTIFNVEGLSKIGVKTLIYAINGETKTETSFTLPVGAYRLASTVEAEDGEIVISTFEIRVTAILPVGGFTNYPNPFSPPEETTLEYVLESSSHVTLKIYSLMGHLVWEREFSPGEEGGQGLPETNKIPWDGKNNEGQLVGNGGYIASLEVDGKKRVIRKIAVEK